MDFGLDNNQIEKIISILNHYPAVKKAVIFGSRARGDHKYNSDIDIAVYTDGQSTTGLSLELEEAAGILKTNLIIMNQLTNEALRRNIEQDGIEIYSKTSQ